MSLTLANATLATLSPPSLWTGDVTICRGRIVAAGTVPEEETGTVVNCAGHLVMPANVCAHTHLYSALARGMPAPPKTPHNFPEILEYIWWRLDRALDAETIRYSALIGALDAARCGTGALVDHHASPNFIAESLDLVADALEEVGLRGILCYEVTDRGGIDRRTAGLEENARFIRSNSRPLMRGMVGAHASFTLDNVTLRCLAELADEVGTGIHIHVAEDVCDEEDSLRRAGKRTAFRLADAGILSPAAIAAHGVHLDADELDEIKSHRSWLVHNCRSNLNNGVGRAPVAAFGSRAALGTDGIDHDMFSESRTAYFRGREEDLSAYAEQYASLLARGAELIGEHFSAPFGRLDPGAAADLIILAYDPPTPLTEQNLAWHWMFGMASHLVRGLLVGGEWVIKDGEFCNVDEEKIRAVARDQASSLWQKMEAL